VANALLFLHAWRRWSLRALVLIVALSCGPARASLFTGETLDTVADVMSWVVLIVVPIIGIVVFWIVHVMPEKIAHRRHHPQTQAIQTLCLLSLVFGGLLWPIAWLWAYTKPVAYKAAYGTEKGEHYFEEEGERALRGELPPDELTALRDELDVLAARGLLPAHLAKLRNKLAARDTAPELTESVSSEPRRARV
jgi:uncharacterized protein DUF3302